MADFTHAFARRTRMRGGDGLTSILAGSPPGVLSMTGGFPNPATFPTDELDEIAARLLRDDAAVALQYTPCEGIASVREYLVDRQEQLQGRRPEPAELIVTSGGMECIALMCQTLIDPGDTVVVEAPSYLGALMAFGGAEADTVAIATDDEGLRVDALAERLADGLRPKFVYTIPEYQNPTGRTLPLERRHELVELCRRHRALIFEDVAYRELPFDGASLPSLWSLAPDIVVQAGTFSKSFFPGVRLGWATGPAEVIAELAAAKQITDQCAGGLGQRLVEEYGRAGGFERHLPAARALYASHWAALSDALGRHMPEGVGWTEPAGGFLTWVTLPDEVDTLAMRSAATAAGVAYVPGAPFHVGANGHNTLRLSFSHLTEVELETAVERLAAVVRAVLGIDALTPRRA
ncbi:MAG TPA: PLP-dependent aminotransferase family protein [Solirubrobacteraceae bacterium]|nr:PLP-dependent aminotransferase family protein [Solirubrobacteraceae bacterium]